MDYVNDIMKSLFYDFNSDIVKINFATKKCSCMAMENGCVSEKIFDYTIDEFKLMLFEAIHPDDREYVASKWSEKISQRYFEDRFMLYFRRKDKDDNWGKCSVMVVLSEEEGEKTALIVIYKDVKACSVLNSLTYGMNNMQHFYQTVEYKLEHDKRDFCLVAISIKHFKLYNKWFGRDKGQELLIACSLVLKKYEKRYGAVAAYSGSYNFIALMPHEEALIIELEQELFYETLERGKTAVFSPAMGIYLIDDRNIDVEEMHDYAADALSHSEKHFSERICYYDKVMSSEEENEVNVLTNARSSLFKDEFVIYIQPQVRMQTGQIVGGEALVRWKHPEKGFVFPNEFIPILEKTGFISNLDQHVWELVCRTIRSQIDRGIEPVPISINISRIDILTCDVVKCLNCLVDKYRIDKKYLKIEITESAYINDAETINVAIQKFHEAGYVLFMDDFGSGYSSLNMLKQVVVDAIKLDMKFLDFENGDVKKGIGILKSVISLANEIAVPIIMEGVETDDQVGYLQGMGVRFAQGYHYYRPMPVENFEELIINPENVDYKGIYGKNFDLDVMDKAIIELLENRNRRYEEVHISKTRGGFIEYYDNEGQELIRMSESVPAIYGCKTADEFRAFVGNSFIGMVHPEDFHRVDLEIKTQLLSSEWKMDYVEYRIIRKDGEVRYISDYGFWTESHEDGKPRFYVFLLDVTDKMK